MTERRQRARVQGGWAGAPAGRLAGKARLAGESRGRGGLRVLARRCPARRPAAAGLAGPGSGGRQGLAPGPFCPGRGAAGRPVLASPIAAAPAAVTAASSAVRSARAGRPRGEALGLPCPCPADGAEKAALRGATAG